MGVDLPYSPKWYWPFEGYSGVPEMERYFDLNQIFSRFLEAEKEILLLNKLLSEAIQRGGRYAFDLSGPFLEQCRWDSELLGSFRKLGKSGSLEFTGSCRYHSLSALYQDSGMFEEEVHSYRALIRELLGIEPETFVNTELLFSGNVENILDKMGYKCIIAEGSSNLLEGCRNPAYLYEGSKGQLPTLLRHINLSEDLEIRFSDRKWESYPLLPQKFSDWISNIEGDVLTLYFNYTSLCFHKKKKSLIADFIRTLPETLKKRGIEMLTPSEAVKRFNSFKLPFLEREKTIRYGMNNAIGNHAQHLYLRELLNVGEELENAKQSHNYWKLKRVFGYLQQSEIFFAMNSGTNVREGYERAVNYFSILSDFRRAVIEEGT